MRKPHDGSFASTYRCFRMSFHWFFFSTNAGHLTSVASIWFAVPIFRCGRCQKSDPDASHHIDGHAIGVVFILLVQLTDGDAWDLAFRFEREPTISVSQLSRNSETFAGVLVGLRQLTPRRKLSANFWKQQEWSICSQNVRAHVWVCLWLFERDMKWIILYHPSSQESWERSKCWSILSLKSSEPGLKLFWYQTISFHRDPCTNFRRAARPYDHPVDNLTVKLRLCWRLWYRWWAGVPVFPYWYHWHIPWLLIDTAQILIQYILGVPIVVEATFVSSRIMDSGETLTMSTTTVIPRNHHGPLEMCEGTDFKSLYYNIFFFEP